MPITCKTLNDVYKSKPASNQEMRKNQNKQWREGFVAAKFCEHFEWNDESICFPVNDKGDDVFVKYDSTSYPFQIAEMAPKNPDVKKNFPHSNDTGDNGLAFMPYGSLKDEVKKVVCSLVAAKDNKHYANQNNMNLLIYLNPPGGVCIDAELDINQDELCECVQSSKFKTISLYTGSEIIFIKGNVTFLAQKQFLPYC